MRRHPMSARRALEDTGPPAPGDHTVKVDLDADVKDNQSLCQAIVKATGQMLGEISQQIVEFDTERKQADVESGKRLLASTELIAKRLATVEKEVLEGQRHLEMIDQLNMLTQLVQERGSDEAVLSAINSISVEPTDLSPVLNEMGTVHKRHNRLEEMLLGVQDSHTTLHGKHGEQAKLNQKLHEVLLSVQESHANLHSKHAKMMSSQSKLEDMLSGLHDGNAELHNKHTDLLGSHDGIRQQLLRLQDSYAGLHDKHQDILSVVKGIELPDLSPVHEHFSAVGDMLSAHGGRVTSIEQRLHKLEKSDQEQRHILEALLQRLPQDLDKQLKSMQGDLRATRTAVQQDMSTLFGELQSDVKGLQKETQQLRFDGANNTVTLEKEIRKLQQAVADVSKQFATTHKQHASDVLTSIEQIQLGPDLEAITSGVSEKLKKVSLRMDHSPIVAALECIPDMHQRLCHVHDKVSSANVHYDPSEVLKAIGKIKSAPDHDTIASAVHDRIAKANIKVDQSELLRALGKLDLDKALEAHSSAMDGKFRKHSSDILKAVGSVPDHETIANALQDRLKGMTLNVDHAELKQMIRRIPTEHDHDSIASAVHDRMGSAIASAGNHGKIIDAIGSLKVDPDLTVVLEAIEAMEESVLTTVLEAIQGIDLQVCCKGGLPASVSPGRGKVGSAKVRQAYNSSRLLRSANSPGVSSTLSRLQDSESTSKDSQWAATPKESPRTKPKPDRASSSPEYEVPAAEGLTMACSCGYSCGTQTALERHLARFTGQKGHRAAST